MKKILLLLLSFLLFPLPGFGQSSHYYFKRYQIEDGLSSNTAGSICQDKNGFMWFGTPNGLNRFDGTSFKVFLNDPNDSTSLGSNRIVSLCEDFKQQLWVGTSHGIFIYNQKKDTFAAFKKIPAGNTTFIQKGNQHQLWIVTDWILYNYDELTGQVITYPFKNAITQMLINDTRGTPWVTTGNGQVKKFDQAHHTFQNIVLPAVTRGKRPLFAMRIFPVGDTALIVCDSARAYLYNYKAHQITDLFATSKGNRDIFTYVIFHAQGPEYWLGTETGIFIVNVENKNVQNLRKSYTDPHALTDDGVRAIYRDKEGGNWIATFDGGINYNNIQYHNFTKYFPQPGINSLSGNVIHEICKDQYNKLWVGTEDAGLNKLDLKTGEITHFLPGDKKGAIAYKNVQGLLADGNKLWIGTPTKGIDVMDLITHKVTRHYRKEDHTSGLSDNFIITLYKTKSGDILAGTNSGLLKYNRKTDSFIAVPFFNHYVQALHQSDNGTLWVCSYGNGVFYQNAITGKSGHLSYSAKKDEGLVTDDVNSVFEDKHGNMWFCTESGLSFYNPKTQRFKNYTLTDGLPDVRTFRILEDSYGFLWISTGKGLARFDPVKNNFVPYHTTDGLPTEQFNFNSSFKDTDGTMYFGTLRGMISFKPEKIIRNNFIPPVYITDLQINHKEVIIGPGHPLRHAVIYTTALTLPYNQANITLDVAALSFVSPLSNQYQYKMDGIDSNWITLTSKRKIYYTNLPPGAYHFRIKGSNNDGLWNTNQRTLSITILPPYWKTTWAYLLYFLILIGITGTIFRYNFLAASEKNKRKIETIKISTEREIYNAKIEFFTNIAHELRTPLTLIKMPLDKIMNEKYSHPLLDENLAMIYKNTDRLIDLTDELLDFRKTEANSFSLTFTKTDINELLKEVYSDFKLLAEQKSLQYMVEIPRLITISAYIDREAFKKILTNLVSNAIKYAENMVKVRLLPLNTDDELFTIEVKNDGFMIPQVYHEKVFEPFFRLKETEKEVGSGIGLPLARSLALLHKGNIRLETDGQINVFLVSIPMHQDREPHRDFLFDAASVNLKRTN